MKDLEKALRPETELHRRIVDGLVSRLQMSADQLTKRQTAWEDAEKLFLAYMPETDNDALRKETRKDGHPQYTTVEIPYTYASLLAAHTYYTSVFLSRTPVLQFTGRHGESQMAESAVESLMDYQTQVGGHMVPYYIWLLDPGKYGMGVVGYYWEEEVVNVARYVEVQDTFLGMPVGKPRKEMQREEVPGYVGNKMYNVRPADFFFDPRVPAYRFQEGEFCGRYVEIPYTHFVQGAKRGVYFNVDQLKSRKAGTRGDSGIISRQRNTQTNLQGINELPDQSAFGREDSTTVGMIPCYEVYVRLVPKDWGVDKSADNPEIWVFTLTVDGMLVGAQPLGEYHNKFPFGMMEYEPDGYSVFSRGMVETVQPLNYILSWLFNSHFYNVRQTLNNQFIVDPSRLVMKDLENPSAGGLYRLKPSAYGTDVRTALTQIPVQDVTAGHVRDSGLVIEMMQRAIGVNDNIMGAVNASGRKTATEVRSSTSFGINRLKTNCEYFSAMGFGPMSQLMLQTSQQRYSLDRKYRIVGDAAQFAGEKFMQVGPEAIAGFYDFVPVDGTLPVDRYAQANLWQQLIGQVSKVPQVAGQYDLGKIFGWVAQLAGIKNLERFRINIVPDEVAMQNAQRGNSIPMKGTPPDAAPNQIQLPGMGSTF
jgi:hypothetical protein